MTKLFDDSSWRSIQQIAEEAARLQQQLDTTLTSSQSIQQAAEAVSHYQQQLDTTLTSSQSIQQAAEEAARLQQQIDENFTSWQIFHHEVKEYLYRSYQEINANLSSTTNIVLRAFQSPINRQWLDAYFQHLPSELKDKPDTHEVIEVPETELWLPETRGEIISYSPSLSILQRLRASYLTIHDLSWRQLEELVADLLSQDGYEVTLGPGSKDGGKDIIAVRHMPGAGFFMALWQAKKLRPGKPVGIDVIRELADTRQEHKASKGIIVTTTSLTKGALARIERDCYLLHKVDGLDLDTWIHTGQQP